MEKTRPKPAFDFIAGRLCLDFANTADWHRTSRPGERLQSCAALAVWAQAAGQIDAQEARQLTDYVGRHPGKARKILRRAIALREAVYRIFSDASEGKKSSDKDLELLNFELAEGLSRRMLTSTTDGYSWKWEADTSAKRLTRTLWEVARSAAELLTSPPELARVRQCADDRGCGWLFFDTSRNRTRKWCDIRDCGNRAKARRHYERRRRKQPVASTTDQA